VTEHESILVFIAEYLDGKNPPCPECGYVRHDEEPKKISYFRCEKCGFKININ